MAKKATIKVASAEEKSAKAATGNNMKKAVGTAVNKKFDLDNYKKSKNLLSNSTWKKQEWIPLSPAFNNAISLPGLPHGGISLIRGHSDTGKSTALCEAAISAQKLGKLPVLIITEMKFKWSHFIKMGFDAQMIPDPETGEVQYTGDFIYVDRDSLSTIEDVAAFIVDILDEQKKGKLPYDLVFLWDSAGSIPCQMSIDSGKNNNLWNAGAMATQFGNFINQRFALSKKPSSQYTNSFYVVNKIRVELPPPCSNPKVQPKLKNKAGDALYWDAEVIIEFGNVTNAGTSKIKATKNGKDVVFAKRTKIAVDKNHTADVTTRATIIMTAHGFIEDTPKAIEQYKKEHRHEWLEILGSDDFDIVEEPDVEENIRDVFNNIEADDE